MTAFVLVTYTMRYGSTQEVAEALDTGIVLSLVQLKVLMGRDNLCLII
jgi:hypothetical protein